MSVNPKTLVEKFIKDSKGRSRLAAATSVLAVFTVLITVGALTFPAISVSGSEEALREQGIDITVGQTAETEEVVAPPADEAPIVAYEEASEAPEATQAENVAEAITEESQIGEVADVPAEASEAAIAEGDEEAIDTEGEEGEEEAEEEDPEKQEAEAEVEASDAAKQALEAADLSSQRLIIGTADANALAEETSVVANFDNVYLLQFENETEAAKGFLKYFDAADFVTPDVAVEVAEDDTDPEEEVITTDNVYTEDENPFAELEAAIEDAEEEIAAEATKQDALIAVIDTGAATSENVVEAISVLGEDGADDNGHGQRMVDYVLEQNEDARILSIKALGKDGKGDVSAVIAGINYAIERGANIINLSMSAYASEENAALADAVQRATEAGILVVGAAGNNGFNAKYYIPGNIEEALVVGAADETGTRIAGSNFGLSVDYNVVSAATSEAAARMSGFVSANTIAGIDEVLNQGLIYTTDYNAADAELLEEEAEEPEESEDASLQAAGTRTITDWGQLRDEIAAATEPTEFVIAQSLTVGPKGGIEIPAGKDITISGGTINGGNSFNEFFWVSGGSLTVKNTTFVGGGTHKSTWGYFIMADAGEVTLSGCTFKNASSSGSEAVPVYVRDARGPATLRVLENNTFENNNMTGANSAGAITVSGSRVKVELNGGADEGNAIKIKNNTATRAMVRLAGGSEATKIHGVRITENRTTGSEAAPIVVEGGSKATIEDTTYVSNNKNAYPSRNMNERSGGLLASEIDSYEKANQYYEGGKSLSWLGKRKYSFFQGKWDPHSADTYWNVSNNTAGALYINDGNVTMTGGEFDRNYGDVGAVLVKKGTFTQTGGIISNNIGHNAGAVSIVDGLYSFTGGTLSGNKTFTFSTVNVSNNKASFVFDGGHITGNETLFKGGGVYVNSNDAHLISGEIDHNTALLVGGGVYQENDTTMVLEGAAVYNNNTNNAAYTDSNYTYYGTVSNAYDPKYFGYEQGHGGGIWSCYEGEVEINTKEVHVFNNSATDSLSGAKNYKINGDGEDIFIAIMDNKDRGKLYKFTRDNYDNWHRQTVNYSSRGASDYTQSSAAISDKEIIDFFNGSHEYGINNSMALQNVNRTYDTSNTSLLIHDNTAPLGGGVGTNGRLTVGRSVDTRISANMTFQKTWVDGATPKDIRISAAFFTLEDEHVYTWSAELPAGQKSVSVNILNNVVTSGNWAGSLLDRLAGLSESEHTIGEIDSDGTIGLNSLKIKITEELKVNGQWVPLGDAYELNVADLLGTVQVTTDTQTQAIISTKTINLKASLENTEKNYSASLLKTDEAGTPLQGATFRLYYMDGNTKMYATKTADGKVAKDGWTSTLPTSGSDNTLWVTPANGRLVFENLTPGTYSVEEVSAPSGYLKSDEPVTFVIQSDGLVRYANGSFASIGTAAVGNDGALTVNEARVRNNDDTRDLFLQTLSGAKATSIVAGETYLISEYVDQSVYGAAETWYVRAYDDGALNFDAGNDNYTNGPMGSNSAYFRWTAEELEGYTVLRNVATGKYLVYTDSKFKHVARADVLQGISEITVENQRDLHSLKLFKTNGSSNALPGATFRLYYLDNNVKMYAANNNGKFTKWENSPVNATIWTVPSTGILEFDGLNSGRTYYIEEVSAPEGYNKYEGTISVSISRDGAKTYNGAISDVTVDSETGQLMIAGQRLYAQPGADGTISQGAAVSTTASAYPLIVVERESQEIHNANPTATVVKQLAADTIYAIHIGDTGFYLQGQDSDFASPLANNSGLWTSGYAWKYEVLSDGTKALRNLYGITDTSRYYYLYLENGQIKQTKNAANLLVKNAAGLVVEGDGDTFDIQVDNTPKIPQLILYKTDKNGTKLSGARFYIRELGTGTTKGSKLAYLDEVTTGVYTFNFADAKGSYNPTSYSPTTKYVIWEESAPEGYVAAGLDIVFTIDRNGVINLITEKSEVGSLAEVNADTSTYFTTNSNKIAINVKNDQKGEVKIEKRNTNNEAVIGAVLQILDANKNPVVIDETKTGSERTQWTTDGSAKTIKLPAGKYYLHEVSAPAPYQCAADMEFTLSSSNVGNDCISLVMYDPKPGEIIITKVDHQGQGLAGAVLQILNAQKKPVTIDPTKTGDAATQWISNGKSYTIPVTLEPGTYYIHEVSAPEGYVAAADQEFVVKDSTGSATTAFDSTARCTVSISNSSIPRITITSDGVSHTGFCLAETVKNINSYSATPVSIDNLPADVPNRTSIDRNKDKIAKILWLGSTNDKAGLFSYYANRVAKDNVRGGSTGAFTDESFTEDDFRIATQAAVWYYTGGKNPASRSDLTNVQMAAALALLRIVEGSSITYIETGESDSPRNRFDKELSAIISKTYTYPSNMKLNVYYSGNAQPVIDPCFPGGSDGANIDRTVVNVPKTVDIEIIKKWYDENGNDITAANPQYKGEQFTEVTVTLKRTTEGVENSEFTQELKVTKAASDNASITIDGLEYQIEDTAWGLTIKGLPYAVNINKEVKKYNYSITETVVEGFTTENASPNAVKVEGSGTLEGTYTFTLNNKVTTPRYELDLVKVDTRDLPAIQTAIGSITVNNQAAIDAIKEKAKAGKGLLSNDVTFVLIDNNVNPSVEIGMDVEDGVIKFKDLKPGMYRLRETVQPKGYQPNTTIWYIQIEENGEVKMSSREPVNDTLDTSVAEGIVQVGNTGLIAVGNEITTYVLPSTGGIGTQVFAVIGALLMLVAGALFVRRTGRQNA